MKLDDAIALLGPSLKDGLAQVWADLGCGTGTFTRALARTLPAGSIIHAMDQDPEALDVVPDREGDVVIHRHHGDLTHQPWPWSPTDGVLFANSLHYVKDLAHFLTVTVPRLGPHTMWIVVEYDTDVPRVPWVPYPRRFSTLARLAAEAGFARVERIGSHRSIYGAPMYSARLRYQ